MKREFQFQNQKINYNLEGEGIAVILIHGFAETGSIWDLQVKFLKDYCKAIVPDLPGSGLSADDEMVEWEKQNNSDIIEYYADCIYALLLHENVSQCIMLGHSMGGYITLAFAEKYIQLLKGFGLINSTAFADNDEKKEARKKSIAIIEKYGGSNFLKTSIPNLFSLKFKTEHPEQIEQLIKQAQGFSKEMLIQYYIAMMNRPDRTHVLKSSKVPVLFVTGTEDNAAPLNDVLQQVHLAEISYIHILENAAHMSMWEATSILNNHLLAYINEVSK